VSENTKPDGYVFGRPTKYRPEMCERAVELGLGGASKVEIAFELGVTKATLDNWAAEHSDFLAAITRAKEAEQVWWEREGRSNLKTQGYQASMWSRSMAARFPDDWREKVGHVGGNKDDEPIKQEVTFGADAFTRTIASLASRSGEDGKAGGSDA
jgi:transposase